MSGEKDEEKMAPMFPRLHVNDAEKPGPKAPPRNKMALYEQFSIPSHRFKSEILTPTSTHVSDHERNLPLHVSSSTHTHHAEKFHAGLSDGKNMSTLFTLLEHRKNFGDAGDFTVPELFQSGIAHDSSRDKLIPPGSEGWGRSTELQNGCYKLRPEVMTKSNDKNDQSQTHSTKIAINLSGEEEIDTLVEEENESLSQTFQDKPTGSSSLDRRKHGNCVFESAKDKKNIVLQPTNDSSSRKNIVLQPTNDSSSRKNNNDSKEIANESGHSVVRTKGTPQLEDAEKSEAVSETSTVDSVSGFSVTPDDVVGIIGQKNFWKARRAMVNQQKVFAVQLFELHRLIKVQQLMAGSPHLLLEDRTPQASSSLKACSAKILPSEFIAKPQTHIADKTVSKKITHKVECSAENTVGKMSRTSLFSRKTSHCGPYSENPKPCDWGFHQPPEHQWLIPVMSPSEGLVYKPYSAPGVASTAYGSMMNPAYGIPCNPQVDHAYTPHYGMPLINSSSSGLAIEKISWYPRPPPNRHMQNQCLYNNVQAKKDGAVWQGGKVVGSKLGASTASSSCERGWRGRKDVISKGREPLPLFPAEPAIEEPTQVIRVVPHNRIYATTSAARIFRSIQRERKLNNNDRRG